MRAKAEYCTLNTLFLPLLALFLLLADTAFGQAATGGLIRRYRENGTNFIAHLFTNSAATDTFSLNSSTNVEYLVVAGGGGGGGGYQGGGGGAGGVRFGAISGMAAGSYTVTVGAGGAGARTIGSTAPSNGLPSSAVGGAVNLATTGGGRGYSENPDATAASGGSGGGSGRGGAAGVQAGSGGGGAGGAGTNAVGGTPGGGGAGRLSTMRDGVTAVIYAAGGKGQYRISPSTDGASKANNTGDGGDGGGCQNYTSKGGNGGSGIVIVRYQVFTLTVNSTYGGASPGTVTNASGTLMTQSVTNSPVYDGGMQATQYVCTGWALAGNADTNGAAAGSGTNVTLTLTNNATLTWGWTTNYYHYLTLGTNGSGTLTLGSGFYAAGSSVTVTATPAQQWVMAGWSGDTNGCTIGGTTLTAPIDRPRSISADFRFFPSGTVIIFR